MAGVPPKKAVAFSFTTALTLQSDTKLLKANPTLAAGDCQVSKDFGAFANLTTLPDAEPDAGYAIRVQLSATEMDADVVTVLFHDAAGAEWCDQLITILTDTATVGEVEAQTDDIGVAGAGLTAIPTIASVASVETVQAIAATGLASIAAAVWAYATRTLTSIAALGADVWTYATRTLTQSAASVTSTVSGSTITATRGDTLSASLTGLGNISAHSKLWVAVKADPDNDADTAAILLIEKTAGLTVVNGAPHATITNGSIVVTNETTGAITITVEPAVTALLAGGAYRYDVQMLTAAGVVQTLTTGNFVVDVTTDVTRVVS